MERSGAARDIERLASDAKSGKAKMEDLQGSTFTVVLPATEGA